MTKQKKVTATKSADAKVDTPKGVLLMIDPQLIVVQKNFNVRLDFGDLEELKNSIVENGMKNPMHGFEKEGKYVLTDGERRFRAVQLALQQGKKIEKVPFLLEAKTVNDEDRTLGLLLYNDGKPLSMLEQSEVIRRLLNFGWRMNDIVSRTGKGRGYLENLVMLTKSPLKVQHLIREDKISAHTIIQIMRAVKGDEAIVKAVDDAIQNAQATGKTKATPKHLKDKEARKNSFGSFYRWVEDLGNKLADRQSTQQDVSKSKEAVVYELLVQFENQKKTEKLIEEFFVEKKK